MTTREPIYVDTAQMLPVIYAVASVLILLTLLVVYADIVKPINAGRLSGTVAGEHEKRILER